MTDDPPPDDTTEESLLRLRMKLYGVYDTPEALREALQRDGVDTGETTITYSTTEETRRSSTVPSNDNSEIGSTPSAVPVSANTRQSTDRDVWGRFPKKEADQPILCPSCARPFSTMRFAFHLDKCMGIGATSRSASVNK